MGRYIVTFVVTACTSLGALAQQSRPPATNSIPCMEDRMQRLDQRQRGLACELTPQAGSRPETSVEDEADEGAGPSLEPALEAEAPEGAGPGVTQARH
jgi:hypothetical protein